MASYSPLSSFAKRVSTFPLISRISKSERCSRSCAALRGLLVPTIAPFGNSARDLYRTLIKTSLTCSLLRIAPKEVPEQSSTGKSLRLCTAQSISPANNASSSSFVKSPLSPEAFKDRSSRLSPFVLIMRSSTLRSG